MIYYVSAPCGVGKTHAACEFIRTHHCQKNHLYVAPSRDLIQQTKLALELRGLKPTVITCDRYGDHVKASINEFMKNAMDYGTVLLITWNAYVDLAYLNRRENWTIIIDEIPQVDRFYGWRLPRHLSLIVDHIDLIEGSVNDRVAKVIVKDQAALEARLEGRRDDVDEMFRPFLVDLLSPNKDMFVDLDSWNRLAEKRDFTDDDDLNRLSFISMLNPRPFQDAILLGANVEDSMLHPWLTKFHGCRFTEHRAIASGLRRCPDDIGSRVEISYFIPKRHASKTLYGKAATTGGILIDEMDREVLQALGTESFLYVANNDRKSFLNDHAGATRMSVVSHGLNRYDRFNNIYFSPALNREPMHFAILKALGLDADVVHRATAHETMYQCVMRTSLRNPDSTAKVRVIVPDEPSARRLAQLLGVKNVTQLGSLYEPPPKPLTATQKDQRHEAQKRIDDLFESARRNVPESQPAPFINDDGWILGTVPDDSDDSEEDSEVSTGGNLARCFVTFHQNSKAKERNEFIVKRWNIAEFLAFMRVRHRAVINTKDASVLFNAAVFDPPEGAEGYRRKDYFKASSFMVLDFDDGDLSPEEFERIFWNGAGRGQKRSFMICNSFSRCEAKPNKFRVIMFYKRPATSLQQHEAVYDAIVSRLEVHGYSARSVKLDPACRSGVQSFYLPCTNRAHREWAFFNTFGTKTRDLERCSIDPVIYGQTATPASPKPTAGPMNGTTVTRNQIDAVIAPLRSMCEGRNSEVLRVGLEFWRLGLAQHEIEAELHQAVGPEPHMQKKVRGVISSLRKYGRIR